MTRRERAKLENLTRDWHRWASDARRDAMEAGPQSAPFFLARASALETAAADLERTIGTKEG